MPDPNRIPLSVSVTVCTDCGKYGAELDSCRAQKHHLSHVGYVISDTQTDRVAIRRIDDLKARNRRPSSEAMSALEDRPLAEDTALAGDTPLADDTPLAEDTPSAEDTE